MARRPAFHTVVRGLIPFTGSFFFQFFSLLFQIKASVLASVVQKPPIPTNHDCYLQNRHDSGYIFGFLLLYAMVRHVCIHRIQKIAFYLMNFLRINRIEQNGQNQTQFWSSFSLF